MTKKQLKDRSKKYADDKESCMYCEDCVEREMKIIKKGEL
jgi:hypothetical protein